jgi:hypothetical protein
MKGKGTKSKTHVAHLDHLMFCGPISPQTPRNPSIQATKTPPPPALVQRERERSSATAATASSARAVTRAHFPASCAVITDCKVSPTKLAHHHLPLLARRHLPLLPPVMAASSATSRRDRRLLYSRADAFLLVPPRLSPGDEQRRADPSPYSQIQGDGTPHLSKPP